MGVFETIFKKPKGSFTPDGYFQMLNGYLPVFTKAPESVYEMELTVPPFIPLHRIALN